MLRKAFVFLRERCFLGNSTEIWPDFISVTLPFGDSHQLLSQRKETVVRPPISRVAGSDSYAPSHQMTRRCSSFSDNFLVHLHMLNAGRLK